MAIRKVTPFSLLNPPSVSEGPFAERSDAWWIKSKNQAFEEAIHRLEHLLHDEPELPISSRISGVLAVLRKGLES